MPAKGKWEYFSEEEIRNFYETSTTFNEMFVKMGYARYNAQTLKKMRQIYPWLLPYFKGEDLTGKVFGELTVVKKIGTIEGRVHWLCKCSCGKEKETLAGNLVQGITTSCGCKTLEKCRQAHSKDLSNQIFGRLTVLYRSKTNYKKWVCKCICGNTAEVTTSSLLSGHTKSCGCLIRDNIKKVNFIDLTGQKFGKLTVLHQDISKKKKVAYWKCQCECGNVISVSSHLLRTGRTRSCGCIKSFGEEKIANILTKMNINYEKEKSFQDLNNGNLRFDFYLPELQILIEYQGEQHYKAIDFFGGQKRFKEQQSRDNLKREYCKEKNYSLIEIPYWDYQNIDETYLLKIIKGDIKWKNI